MELLRSHLSRVRIPEPSNRIYKQECCVSFDTPRSEGGLYIDMSTFLAFGKDYVEWNYEKTGNPVYLHIQETRKSVPEDRPLKKPTLLAIGVDGGFESQELEYEATHKIVVLPTYVELPFPSVELPEKVRLAVDAILMSEGIERKEQITSWVADKKKVSAYAMDLQQIDNGVVIPPSGWRCCKCDKDDNLWLNLTDGMILCGRRNWDGTGGNNHAIEYYNETKYPLAVKLGTITADLEGADVFSYPEDESVEDPLLAQHLAFFGIDFSSLKKADGVDNPTKPTSSYKQEGIPPRMFKAVLAANHPEFSSMRQQDALEFFLHLLDRVEHANARQSEFDPSRSFKFLIEERIACPSGRVAYNKRVDYILSLNIPLHEATNKEELMAFQKSKAEELNGSKTEDIVRPRVPLEACLASFSAPEEVQDFYSSALNAKTTAIKTAGFLTFPDYLVLHMRKFVMEEGWVPKKLDVYIDVPDTIDISHMCSKGLQPGEELLQESDDGERRSGSAEHLVNEDIVAQLVTMGFSNLHCRKAVINTSSSGVEEAMNWLLSHMDDPDIDDPISEGTNTSVNEAHVSTLISFGFEADLARKALKASGGDIEKATDWIFSHQDAAVATNMDASSSNPQDVMNQELPDGHGRYKLVAFISHMGTSTHCGHYVAHVLKEGRWVIFNDAKVGASVDPPRDMGYLYFFERIIEILN
ncbi:Ubiquitin carboxyl-terminal hydrolase 14 [Nymphaea thermarum]|nr:Ubiquitin carboxyl-terminal hydrolase 14 [Nymphaea thermarum]